MTDFSMESYFQPYLSVGAKRIDAIVSVAASGAAAAAPSGSLAYGFAIDTSGSMDGSKIEAAKKAVILAIDLLPESARFFVVGFSHQAALVVPPCSATAANRRAARDRVSGMHAGGGTKMSSGLCMAAQQMAPLRDAAVRQVMFLTDGKNENEERGGMENAFQTIGSLFQCDCRGVGTDWNVAELRRISDALMGTTALIADASKLEADFRETLQGAAGRGVGDVRLRLWMPKSAALSACKQTSPQLLDLMSKVVRIDDKTIEIGTGSWGAEARDFQLAFELSGGEAGEEVLACRPSLVWTEGGEDKSAKSKPILAAWTEDEALSARLDPRVAHYSGQQELAESIRLGLDARERGDAAEATVMLGKAARIAAESGNEEVTARLSKVVEIVDAGEGTVRLKARVAKADEMDLDAGSTRTARVSRAP